MAKTMADVYQHLGTVVEISDLMLNIINNVRDNRKLAENRMEFELLWVSANSLVGGARKVLAPSIKAAEQKGISFEYFMENDDLFVPFEPYRARQLIADILGNAIKYAIMF